MERRPRGLLRCVRCARRIGSQVAGGGEGRRPRGRGGRPGARSAPGEQRAPGERAAGLARPASHPPARPPGSNAPRTRVRPAPRPHCALPHPGARDAGARPHGQEARTPCGESPAPPQGGREAGGREMHPHPPCPPPASHSRRRPRLARTGRAGARERSLGAA